MKSHWGGVSLIPYDWRPYRKVILNIDTQKKDLWGPRKRWPSISQGKRPQKKPTLLTHWYLTSSLQNCEKINFCCLIQPLSLCFFFFLFFKYFILFIYLAALDISCGLWTLNCNMWNLVLPPGTEHGPPALGVWSLATRPAGKSLVCVSLFW